MEDLVVKDAQRRANEMTDDDVKRLDKEALLSSAGHNEVKEEKQEQSVGLIEDMRQLAMADDEDVGGQQPSLIFVECNHGQQSADDGQRSTVQVLSLDEQQQPPPEILVAYLSGEPEAVAAIELLREAQRIWDQRKRSVTPAGRMQPGNREQSSSPLMVDVVDIQPSAANHPTATRRYSHEDLRIAYTNISAQLVASERKMMEHDAHPVAAVLPVKATKQHKKPESQQHYRRRASAQAESLAGQAVARYQHKQQPLANKKNSIPGTVSTSGRRNSKRINGTPRGSVVSQQHETDGIHQHPQRPRSSRGSVDVVSQAMTTGGMGAISNSSSRRNSSLTDSAYLKVNESMVSTSRRSSSHRMGNAAVDADVLLPLGSDAVSFHREQRRRASSSKASAIFLLSPTGKEGGGQLVPEPEDEDDNSPEGRRRRRTISIIATVGAFLLVLSILMVTVTLRLATHIDDLVRKENELQTFTSVSSNGDMINGTASNNVFSPQQTGQLGTILNSTTTTAATPSIIALLAASNSSTMNLT
ncbi:uncharacterized protein LOC130692067 isoform X1 [Daphnia carinata]|uniref:uncharacterized protein LOC130692067 isoform X1 n=1 Tax=Daphnia carinata TaxID=120202 RepID=UPI00257CAA4E|nr:uncharacterized protein LOC130692067 isoform X1 [Daphnia carinata]